MSRNRFSLFSPVGISDEEEAELWPTAPSASGWCHCNNTHLTGSNIRRPHPAVRQPPLSMRVEGGPDTRAHTRTEGAPPVNKQSWILELGSGWWSCGGMSAMAGGGGAGRLCWKTCYFPFVFWLVSVCGEDRTLMVEVGSMTVREEAACSPGCQSHHF